MIRHFVVAVVLGLALSACGVGADEDLSTLGLAVADQGSVATSQDPVPPAPDPTLSVLAADPKGDLVIIAVGSKAPARPGDENASSQDPIPPKIHCPRQMHQFR